MQRNANSKEPDAETCERITPLSWACQNGHTDVVSVLIAAQADIHKACADDGSTPLHVACRSKRIDVALLLLLAGADLDRLDHRGRTPLDVAGSEETRAAVRAYLLPRAEAVEALRFIAETTGLNPDLADIVVYHGLVRRPQLHWGLANEYRANKLAGMYNVAETEGQEEGGALGDAGKGDEGEQGETVAQRVAKRRRRS